MNAEVFFDTNILVYAASGTAKDISYWDAAIIAAAASLGARTLYSEDLNDAQTYGSVRVLNPFR